jgi:hypothetical protein
VGHLAFLGLISEKSKRAQIKIVLFLFWLFSCLLVGVGFWQGIETF